MGVESAGFVQDFRLGSEFEDQGCRVTWEYFMKVWMLNRHVQTFCFPLSSLHYWAISQNPTLPDPKA